MTPTASPSTRLARAGSALILALAVAPVGGCATGAQAAAMVPTQAAAAPCRSASHLDRAIAVGQVTGGSETSSWGSPQVSDESLAQALSMTLDGAGLLAVVDDPPLRLDAHLVELTQPSRGMVMEVIAFLRYRLVHQATEEVLFDDMLSSSCTLDLDDAFLGVKRMRLASECALQRNLADLLEQLCSDRVANHPEGEG